MKNFYCTLRRRALNGKNMSFRNIALLILVLISLIATSCGVNQSKTLEPVQIREYQGEKLSSINDFRENSIAGPQHVDIQKYRLKIYGLVDNPKEYTYDEVIKNHQSYEKVVQLDCVEGWSVVILWQGLLVKDLLAEAKVKPEAKVVLLNYLQQLRTNPNPGPMQPRLATVYALPEAALVQHSRADALRVLVRGAP